MAEEVLDNLGEDSNETLVWANSQEEQQDPKALRHAQQLAGSKAEVERLERIAIDAQKKLALDNANNLLELHKTDPKLANKVAKEFWYASYEEAIQTTSIGKQVEKPQEDFETMYQKKRAEEKHQEALELANSFIEKSKLDPTLSDQAKVQFQKLTNWRTLTPAEALEIAEMATLYVQKEKINEWTYQSWLQELSSTWVAYSKKVTDTKQDDSYEVIRDWKIVLISNKSK